MVAQGRACQREVVLSGRAASTAGQATVEYLAIAVGAVAVAATLATVTPSVGERVTGAFGCVIDRAVGGGGPCDSQSASAGSAEAAQPDDDDGLTERQRAARDLQPGLYDDVPGTAQERINTSTPPPPGGDQCTLSPDTLPGLRLLLRLLRARSVLAERLDRRQADDDRRLQRRVPPPDARPLRSPQHRRARARLLRRRRHLLRGGLGRGDREGAYTPGRARNCLVALKIRWTSKNAGLRTPSNDTRPFWWIGGCGRGLPPSQSGRTRNSCSAK
jgi:hypothetical protein